MLERHYFYFLFCIQSVCHRFALKLPEQYKLLRRKLFRIPQWTSSSDEDGDGDTEAAASDADDDQPTQQLEPSTLVHSHTKTHSTTHRTAQSRSRSLSVSLEQEAGMRRTDSKPRKVLQREVSMSKVFKARRNDGPSAPSVKVEAEAMMSSSATQTQVKGPVVLVEGTPQKPRAKIKIRTGAQKTGVNAHRLPTHRMTDEDSPS
jgi:hypothetical protein